ncbi:hypothetical protein Oscil6304_5229 [Oscillatoria acuminata PCC 6304]|uniref:Uncharacterized protein n=1 Tax=Oscillatoria acuminata PCC 6304 TaxID=56110 RepID=K9TRT7_9CYAN|nr:hypothetical protein Oscil6304_5229 [Oscillatoria acuminata PCC 6304]
MGLGIEHQNETGYHHYPPGSIALLNSPIPHSGEICGRKRPLNLGSVSVLPGTPGSGCWIGDGISGECPVC